MVKHLQTVLVWIISSHFLFPPCPTCPQLSFSFFHHLCVLGLALVDASEAMKELGEVKDALDMEVKQNFIDPLQNLHDKDLKEIQVSRASTASDPDTATHRFSRPAYIPLLNCHPLRQHHLKKMEGRRLDFDYKKKRQGKVQEEEIKQALEKFDESKEVAEQSMFNLLESDVSSSPLTTITWTLFYFMCFPPESWNH